MKAIILYPNFTYTALCFPNVMMKTIRSARDRSHLMAMGVGKELVDKLSGREANELLKALLAMRETYYGVLPENNSTRICIS